MRKNLKLPMLPPKHIWRIVKNSDLEEPFEDVGLVLQLIRIENGTERVLQDTGIYGKVTPGSIKATAKRLLRDRARVEKDLKEMKEEEIYLGDYSSVDRYE